MGKFDWTASALRFQVAVAAINDDLAAATRLAKLSIQAKDLTIDQLREWPIFRELRKTPDVQAFITSGAWPPKG
ncbi:MAG: hypothetical protein QM783_12740 [Phycisphaerales bacterium]